ncbi:MAG TPA: type II CAAX endopeptidase family protein [Anaerolineales bacterium]|nr:type II CAAX endopeptidase family protein [Anaerolineales bacterium]
MGQIPAESAMVSRAFALFWVLVLSAILVAGHWQSAAAEFREKMLGQWKPALVISLLHLLGAGFGGYGFLQISSIGYFCQAMIGLALARSINGFEPLPASQAMVHQENRTKRLSLMLVISLGVVVAALFVNGVLGGLLPQLFGETINRSAGFGSFFPENAWQSFLLLLAGAGISEETTYRLLFLSLFWHLTRRPWVALILSSLLFGAYHLSPLDALYRQLWERPLTVFTMSAVMGVVMGYVYIKHGYETAVLGHTLGDWTGLLLSRMM